MIIRIRRTKTRGLKFEGRRDRGVAGGEERMGCRGREVQGLLLLIVEGEERGWEEGGE